MLLIWREDTNPAVWTEAAATNCLDLCDLGLNITRCVPVPSALPALSVDIKTAGEPSDFFVAGLVLIVSAELRDVLESFNVKAEFQAVTTSHLGKRYTGKDFYFANILDVVDCFDYERSQYKQTPEGVHEIRKLVLHDSKAAGHHLFVVGPLPSAKLNASAICTVIRCASEDLARRVVESGLTGVVFTTPKDRQKYPPPAWGPRQ